MLRSLGIVLALSLIACRPTSPSGLDAGESEFDAGLVEADGGFVDSDAGAPALPPAHAPLLPSARLNVGGLATGLICGECHSATATTNVDEQGRAIGLYEQWSATPMANATRDPFFRAALANEIARAPAAGEAIAGVCLTCHAGLGRHHQKRAGTPTTAALPYAATDDGTLARDGVSCTLCHQVLPANLGQDSSFSGGYELGTSLQLAGPYAAPFTTPMVNRTGFTPVEGRHVQSSALCGTCHALVTEAVSTGGVGSGHLLGEQLTYLEWRRSAFSTEGGGATPRSCQHCHMPDTQADGGVLSTRLAHRPDGTDFVQLSPRGPFSRHGFTGANTVLPRLLRKGRALLTPPASDAALLEVETRAQQTLRKDSGRVRVLGPSVASGVLSFSVRVENLAGHKLPSGYPSRRAFLHVRVSDAAGATLFESGAVDAQQRLTGSDGRPLAAELAGGPFHPHRALVSAPEHVVVYESVMDDGEGRPSSDLLGAEGYLKDNRLLPVGHADSSTGPLSTNPVGVTDPGFGPGGALVRFELALPRPPARIEVALRYQGFSPRYLEQLLARPSPEASALRALVEPSTLAPELIDEASSSFP